jgi:anti-sigma B factor antagonist
MFDQPAVTHFELDDVVVVTPVGEFDISSVDMLRATILDAVSPTQNRLVIDLSRTTFVDSTALGVMVGAGRRINDWGGWLRLVAPQPNVRKVLSLTGLDKVFGLYDTVEQAVSHVEAHGDGESALETA